MESSENFNIPPVLNPEVEKRLVRVFAFLRQHERKAKLAKKVADLSTLKDQTKRTTRGVVYSGVNENASDDLHQELTGDQPQFISTLTTTADTTDEKTRETVVKILEHEIDELQKVINCKDFDTTGMISAVDLSSAFRALNRPTSKTEVQWIIWEVDDDLDGSIDWDEFRGAYARCIADKHGVEPNQFFYLIQFLLSDPDGSASVSVADVKAELQRIRGTDQLAIKIKKALGATTDQQEQERYPLGPYLDAVLTNRPTTFATGSHFHLKQ